VILCGHRSISNPAEGDRRSSEGRVGLVGVVNTEDDDAEG